MKHRGDFEGVIFDFDGTLYAMKGIYKIIFALFCFPRILYLPHYMRVRSRFRGVDFETPQQMEQAFADELKRCYNIKNGRYWIKNSFSTSFIRTLRFMRNRTEYPEIIKSLRRRGIKIALFSDFGLIKSRLRALGIDPDLFDVICSSEDIGALKPAPRTFETVLAHLKTSPHATLVVGDRRDTDGAAAEALDMPFFKVDGKSNTRWKETAQKLKNL
ncbi:MAG: HAD family hydrolase [Fibrobacterota bacterium]